MVVLRLFILMVAVAFAIMLIWNIVGNVILYRDLNRKEQKLKDKLYMESLTKSRTSVPLFELTDDQRVWLIKVGKKIPYKHDIFINRIVKRGYYTPNEKKELNNLRNEYMELIKVEKSAQANLNKLKNDYNL